MAPDVAAVAAFTSARLAELEATAKAATPGPWHAHEENHDNWYVSSGPFGDNVVSAPRRPWQAKPGRNG